MSKPALQSNLKSVDKLLLATQAERDDLLRKIVHVLKIGEIDDFQNHPLNLTDDEEMLALAKSIKEREHSHLHSHARKTNAMNLSVDIIGNERASYLGKILCPLST